MLHPSFFLEPSRRWLIKDANKKDGVKEVMEGNSRCRSYYFRKCKKIRISINEWIPDDLLFEILLRLLPQDIYFVARLVCRKWYHMLRTKYFIHKHLDHTTYGLLYRDKSNDVVFVSTREDGRGIDTCKLNYNYRYTVWSSCNGLMLKYERSYCKYIFYVTNALTDQAFRLPPFPYALNYLEYCGIGYDATSMTYKVVVSYAHETAYGCAMLTVGVDKSWMDVCIDHLSLLGRQTLMSFPILTEGFVHWKRNWGTEVVTLNLETEIIAETPPPIHEVGQLPVKNIKCLCLSTGRSLSLFFYRGNLVWEVFEMKSETGEWRKLATLSLEGQKGNIESLGFKFKHDDDVEINPCGWLKYPEVLALRIQRVFIIFCNFITCEIRAEKLCTLDNFFLVTLHKNSLVWSGGA